MSFEEYEKYQLEIIGQSYRNRGFNVDYQPVIKGLDFQFDAIARNDSGEVIIIELVNKYQSNRAMRNKLQALEKIATIEPAAKVDFRYIDVDSGTLQLARPRPQNTDRLNLKQALRARVPRLAAGEADATRPFLALWMLHVASIRAYGASLGWKQANTDSVLDLYNQMLERQSLVAPEAVADNVTQDLFDLFVEVQGAIQGAAINRETFLQLRGHVVEVRKQVRRNLAQTLGGGNQAE